MKNIFFISVILISFVFGFAFQNTSSDRVMAKSSRYRVIKVNGQIIFIKTGTGMKIGDYFIEGTPLKFSTLKDRAAIFSKEKGRFVLQPNVKGKAKVLSATSNIDTRGGGLALINKLDVKLFFSGRCLFLGPVKIKVGKENFPLGEQQYFYVKYPYHGEVIAKKLPYEGNSIIIDETKLFTIDGKRVPTEELEMKIYYESGDQWHYFNSFTPVFPKTEGVKKEVALLLSELGEVKQEKKKEEVVAFLNEFYGKPQSDNLNHWLEQEFEFEINQDINFK